MRIKNYLRLILNTLFLMLCTLLFPFSAYADNALYGNLGTLTTSSGYINLSFPTVTVGSHYRYLLDVTFSDDINVSSLVFGGSSAYRFGVTSESMKDIITVAGQRVIVDVTFQHVYGSNSSFAIRPSSGRLTEGEDYTVNTYGFVNADTNFVGSGKMMVYDNIISNWTYINNINTYETTIMADTKSTKYTLTDTNTTYSLYNVGTSSYLMASDHSTDSTVYDTNTTYSVQSLLNSNIVTDNDFIFTTVSTPINGISIAGVETHAGTVLRSASAQSTTISPTSGTIHRLSCRPLDFTVSIAARGLNPSEITMSGLDGLETTGWNYSDDTIMISGRLPTYEPDSGAYYEYTEVSLSDLTIRIQNDNMRLPLFFTVESFIVDCTGDGTDTGILLGIKNKLDNLGTFFVTQISSILDLGSHDTVEDTQHESSSTVSDKVSEYDEAESAVLDTANTYITSFIPDGSAFTELASCFGFINTIFLNLFNGMGTFKYVITFCMTLGLCAFIVGVVKS